MSVLKYDWGMFRIPNLPLYFEVLPLGDKVIKKTVFHRNSIRGLGFVIKLLPFEETSTNKIS
jgi:hypothetical protein